MKGKIIFAVVALALIAWAIVEPRLERTEVPVAQARRGTLRAYVEERGRTALPLTHRFFMPVGGRILPITLRPGDRVTKGQVVARLDVVDLDTAVGVAQARIERLQAEIRVQRSDSLEKLTVREYADVSKSFGKVVQTAKEWVVATEAQREFAAWYLKAQEDAARSGAASEQLVQRARTELAQAKVSVIVNQLVAEALELLKIAMDIYPDLVKEQLNINAIRAEALEAQLSEAKLELERLKRDRGRAEVKSPIDGVVLTRHLENEQVVPAGTALLDIGDLGTLEVTAEILSRDAIAVRPGRETLIFGEAMGEATRKGTVERIYPSAVTKLSSLGVEEQRVTVRVALGPDEADAPLGVGYRVRVRIYTDEREGVVIMPRTALIRTQGDVWRVFVERDGKAELVEVELGLANDREVEVRSGVEADERVVIAPPASLRSGDRIEASAR
ncbi:MAG: efflux RND transporter periplasmic adaptor subunit [Planctomycetota bacterium]